MFYYTDGLDLEVAVAAIINVVYAIRDAVNDPLVGFLSDNTRTRWDRRRTWFLTDSPFYIGILVLVYAVSEPERCGNALFGTRWQYFSSSRQHTLSLDGVLSDRPFWLFSIGLTFFTFATSVYTMAIPF